MNKSIKKFCLLLSVSFLTGCNSSTNLEHIFYPGGKVVASSTQTIFFDKEDDMEFQVLDNNATSFVNDYIEGCGSSHNPTGGDVYYPNDLVVSWTNSNQPNYSIFKLADNYLFRDCKDYMTFGNSITLKSLFIDTEYYYCVDAVYDAYTLRSKIYSFSTDYTFRTINVEGVSNTRDVGGAYTTDGEYRVKQGLVYRGANVNSITEKGKEYMTTELGIKSDMDLREPNSVNNLGGVSPIGEDVNLISFGSDSRGCPYYTGAAGAGIDSNDQVYRDALLGYLKAFAVEDNYPIYFHCAIGRDRTGTISFLIQALLGVSVERLTMEYEFSFLSVSGNGDGSPSSTLMTGPFNNLRTYLQGYSTYSLKQNVEQFMLDLGVTAQEIASIRSILLEEVK